jgi:hypothetical protein
MTTDNAPTPEGVVPATVDDEAPVSPDHRTDQDRRRSQNDQNATDIAAG